MDLATEKLHILKSVLPTNNDHDQKIFSLKQFLLLLEKRLIINFEKKELENFLTIDNLRLLSKTQKTSHLDLRFQKELENYEWVQLKTLYLPKNNEKIYLVFSNVDREHIINSITEKFVYKKGDYLYYLDTKNGYFSNFSITDNGTVIPPQEGNNYTQAMIKYTRQNTVLEDQDRVIEQLTPEYILNRLQEQSVYKIELGMLDENKEYRRKLITVQYYDEENKIVLIRRSDITKEYLKQKNQENKLKAIKKAADTDALTGIYNRIGAQRLIVEYLHKSNNEMSAFIIIDLDNFKKINDSLGHLQGDEVLKQVANILKENFRKTDIIARLGGDEFIVFMKNIVQKENAIITLNNLLKKLRLSYQWHEETILITGSIGVAV
ncbi:MAG TPA: GGDEF domain-containing protein, partial [Thomasclavelia ramosa]|nr:GGDEF domain-containing protein [Thomasclavelia ramosa]